MLNKVPLFLEILLGGKNVVHVISQRSLVISPGESGVKVLTSDLDSGMEITSKEAVDLVGTYRDLEGTAWL